MKGSPPCSAHCPSSLPNADLPSYYKDLGKAEFCKQEVERGIQRPAGANDVSAVRKSWPELLKYPLFIARDTFIGFTFPGDFILFGFDM